MPAQVGFTGTKLGMRPAQLKTVEQILRGLYFCADEFHHGDCVGADVQAAKIADEIGYRIGCHPPLNPNYRGWYRWDFVYPEDSYINRDRKIVEATRVLIAAPAISYEITRSGTWTTVRYARELNKRIHIVYPNGSVSLEEESQEQK